jgi:hypothetical protein
VTKKLETLKPDEVVAQIRAAIRGIYGDRKENNTGVWASHGFYYIEFTENEPVKLRRSQITAYFKALAKKEKK